MHRRMVGSSMVASAVEGLSMMKQTTRPSPWWGKWRRNHHRYWPQGLISALRLTSIHIPLPLLPAAPPPGRSRSVCRASIALCVSSSLLWFLPFLRTKGELVCHIHHRGCMAFAQGSQTAAVRIHGPECADPGARHVPVCPDTPLRKFALNPGERLQCPLLVLRPSVGHSLPFSL